MSKEELPSRLRDLSNGMRGLAHDAAYIIQELEEVKAERDNFEAIGNRALARIEEIRAERDELCQTVDRLDDALRLASREKDEWEANYEALANTTPRIITADELTLGTGQWIAYSDHPDADLWITEKYDNDAFDPGHKGTIILLADAPHQEPEPKPVRRGRVVKASELRNGDVYDIWGNGAHSDMKGCTARHSSYTDSDFEDGDEIRLISRKPPVPSENPVILVHRANLKYDEPVLACLMGDHWATPDREKVFYTDSILDWTPARVVPAGQEG